ncbi:MAG TPA: hypothetical protein VIH90_01055 [Candidatus Saccharimonadales bacterium]
MASVTETSTEFVPEAYPYDDVWLSGDDLEKVFAEFDRFSTPGQAIEAAGAESLSLATKDRDPKLGLAINEGLDQLENGPGYFVLKRSGLEVFDLDQAHIGALVLASLAGSPSRPAPGFEISGDLVNGVSIEEQDITNFVTAKHIYKEKARYSDLLSTSVNVGTNMATSSAYLRHPERRIAFFNVSSADDKSVVIKLCDSQAVVQKIRARGDERDTLASLKRVLPFLLPEDLRPEARSLITLVEWAKVIGDDNSIRFDKRSIDAALSIRGISLAKNGLVADAAEPEQSRALGALDAYVASYRAIECRLEPGDVLFVNNRRILHEIEPTTDEDRLLIKVGVNA